MGEGGFKIIRVILNIVEKPPLGGFCFQKEKSGKIPCIWGLNSNDIKKIKFNPRYFPNYNENPSMLR